MRIKEVLFVVLKQGHSLYPIQTSINRSFSKMVALMPSQNTTYVFPILFKRLKSGLELLCSQLVTFVGRLDYLVLRIIITGVQFPTSHSPCATHNLEHKFLSLLKRVDRMVCMSMLELDHLNKLLIIWWKLGDNDRSCVTLRTLGDAYSVSYYLSHEI